ncbi:capsular biosynthesis protein [Pelagerythrobacter marensis]|uniref:Putative exopolysaccharide biosynthesis protein n=1 Tax=Pelagerythrobacter marensis TaxID=543877 RepID=A0A0G3X773_9SPHN|nr:capsular biosynthesis protein [Pelagerythrobacter marensis]AKM07410.1 Putative exopolysaccharide biosynthesis protein [Pelagerythrobacter marensis]
MTEHKKIPSPPEEKKESSLLERASGAFGFDPFKPAPVPHRLADETMKRAKVKRKQADAAAKQDLSEDRGGEARDAEGVHAEACDDAGRTPRAEARAEPAPEAEAAAVPNTLPAEIPPSHITIERQVGAVALQGKRFPVDRELLREQGLIVPDGAVNALMEEFRIVKRRVLETARDTGTARSRRVLICSPHTGEGKTFCASNLAIALAAERDSEVLLIDADFAKPSILSTFGLPKGPGFMDCLADDRAVPEDLVIGTDIPGLWVLPAGNQTNVDSEYLSSRRTAEVLDRFSIGAPNRILIFDSPPALAASPAAELAKHAGQAILVARADFTSQSALEDAVELLSGCPDVKLMLNDAHFSPSGRKFGTYYGYGE